MVVVVEKILLADSFSASAAAAAVVAQLSSCIDNTAFSAGKERESGRQRILLPPLLLFRWDTLAEMREIEMEMEKSERAKLCGDCDCSKT